MLGDYHDIYLKTDVLLLTDLFEMFINWSRKYYGLDPCHYFRSPGLSWDAILTMTGIELYLISDLDMYLPIEKGMRGDISYIAKRYSKANNKCMTDYAISEESLFITYLDANKLNGLAKIQYLPYGGFEWLRQKKLIILM